MSNVNETAVKVKPAVKSDILEVPWMTEEGWHNDLNAPRKAVSYGNGTSGAADYQGRTCKWHDKSYKQIATRYAQQAAAVEAGRDESGDLMFLV
jgi:hypothetical protein